MIDALVSGRLIGKPVSRTARNGSPFATCKLRLSDSKGEPIIASVITFSRSTVDVLMALEDGDSVALSGELSVRLYQDKHGVPRPSLDLQAHGALTVYHVRRRRAAVQEAGSPAAPDPGPPTPETAPAEAGFDDEVLF